MPSRIKLRTMVSVMFRSTHLSIVSTLMYKDSKRNSQYSQNHLYVSRKVQKLHNHYVYNNGYHYQQYQIHHIQVDRILCPNLCHRMEMELFKVEIKIRICSVIPDPILSMLAVLRTVLR